MLIQQYLAQLHHLTLAYARTSSNTWWDDYFSWTDTTKRAALIDALIKGKYFNGILNQKQDVKYARRYWDWTNNCPVDTNGDLVNPDTVLGTPQLMPTRFCVW